jgi:hypothetical protein
MAVVVMEGPVVVEVTTEKIHLAVQVGNLFIRPEVILVEEAVVLDHQLPLLLDQAVLVQ